MERHFFAGGNTCRGFVNFYDNIVDKTNCKRFYIIKGGSGVGKSTMIKTIASYFKMRDYDIEYYHCSGDVDSLDGMKIPELGVAMIDGTFPHMVDPTFVKVTDFVVELSQYVDEKKIAVNVRQLARIMNDKALCYKNAYKWIESVGIIYNNIFNIYKKLLAKSDSEMLIKALYCNLNKVSQKEKTRKLFSGAITAEGESYLANNIDKKIIKLTGNRYLGSFIVQGVAELLDKNGTNYDAFYSPINPEIMYELEVSDTLITVLDNTATTGKTIVYSVDAMAKTTRFDDKVIADSEKMLEVIFKSVAKLLREAKTIHMDIEKCYFGAVDFSKINDTTARIIEEIKYLNADKNIL